MELGQGPERGQSWSADHNAGNRLGLADGCSQEEVRQPYSGQHTPESSEETIPNDTLKAVTLGHAVSAKEQEQSEEARPELQRQMGMPVDSTLTIQTKRRYMSTMPTSTEDLRQKYRISISAKMITDTDFLL